MRNRYWVLRHGRSKANEKGIIVSSLENGVKDEYGLSNYGHEQAIEAGRQLRTLLKEAGRGLENLQILCSPFSRTRETAEAVASECSIDPANIRLVNNLRERYFGDVLELGSHDLYASVWEVDAKDTSKGPDGGGESVDEVSLRLSSLMEDLEAQDNPGSDILLVAHGDTLSILAATFNGTDLRRHREWGLGTAELRPLSQHDTQQVNV